MKVTGSYDLATLVKSEKHMLCINFTSSQVYACLFSINILSKLDMCYNISEIIFMLFSILNIFYVPIRNSCDSCTLFELW